MRTQVFFGVMVVGIALVATVPAEVIDFSTDPNLSTEWTSACYYDYHADGCPNTTAVWNEGNHDLDLASDQEEGLNLLYKNGTTRADSDGITVTFTDINMSATGPSWSLVGLLLSSAQAPYLFDADDTYGFLMQKDLTGDGETGSCYYKLNKAANEQIARVDIDEIPDTLTLDVVRDGDDYVFSVNGEELFRDATYASTSLPYFSMFWGGGGTSTSSARADDFGIVTIGGGLDGDLDGDGLVGSGDLDIVRANWGTAVTPGDLTVGDADGSGEIGSGDLDIVRANWGVAGAAAAVPEPSICLLLLGGLLATWRKR